MSTESTELHGVVRGKLIELDRDSGLPDGQSVSVVLRPTAGQGMGIQCSAGGWADAGDELDEWLAENREARKNARSGGKP